MNDAGPGKFGRILRPHVAVSTDSSIDAAFAVRRGEAPRSTGEMRLQMTRTVAFWATVGAFFLGAIAGAPLVTPLLARFPAPAEGAGTGLRPAPPASPPAGPFATAPTSPSIVPRPVR